METLDGLVVDASKGLQALKKRYATEKEYRDGCVYLAEKCEIMIQIADAMLVNFDRTIKLCEEETAYVEHASGCKYLHRGYYSPSPVFHLFVVGPKKGKLLKRMTCRCNPSFAYGFASDKRLLWSRELHNGKTLGMEYLHYQGDAIYGITLDNGGNLQVITEEIMEDGKIVSYTKYGIATHEIACEQYMYEDDFVTCCQWHRLHIPLGDNTWSEKMGLESINIPIYLNKVLHFENINGELKFKSS